MLFWVVMLQGASTSSPAQEGSKASPIAGPAPAPPAPEMSRERAVLLQLLERASVQCAPEAIRLPDPASALTSPGAAWEPCDYGVPALSALPGGDSGRARALDSTVRVCEVRQQGKARINDTLGCRQNFGASWRCVRRRPLTTQGL